MGVPENIAKLRSLAGMTQEEFARICGLTRGTVSQWETGFSQPRMGSIQRLSDFFGISKAAIIEDGGMDGMRMCSDGHIRRDPSYVPVRPSRSHRVPVVGRIAAGTPREAIAQSGESHELPDTIYYEHEHAFFLTVAGNSMNRLFPEGALVLVDPDEEVRNGDVAVVFVNGDDATLKRVYFDGDSVRLVPESFDPEYRERVIDRSDPDAPLVRIVGKAVSYTAPDGWRA